MYIPCVFNMLGRCYPLFIAQKDGIQNSAFPCETRNRSCLLMTKEPGTKGHRISHPVLLVLNETKNTENSTSEKRMGPFLARTTLGPLKATWCSGNWPWIACEISHWCFHRLPKEKSHSLTWLPFLVSNCFQSRKFALLTTTVQGQIQDFGPTQKSTLLSCGPKPQLKNNVNPPIITLPLHNWFLTLKAQTSTLLTPT